VTFQRTKTWKESSDPDFDVKLDRIEYALIRSPATFHRTHGVTYFHGCYSAGDDTLWGVNRRRKGIAASWSALKSIRAPRPDGGPIYVILDNLSAHKNARILRWAAQNKVELCFTPTNASWANPIEAHFGPLRQFTLANSHHPNHTVQTRELHRYLRWHNQGIRWGGRLLTAPACQSSHTVLMPPPSTT
jgi:hypothetical protein